MLVSGGIEKVKLPVLSIDSGISSGESKDIRISGKFNCLC